MPAQMKSNNHEEEEGETTSLLASSSAPPDQSRPRPTLLNPYNPRDPNQQPQPPPPQIGRSSRQTLTDTTLAEMERGAKRLADDNIDSDSVNGLLAGMEASDDEASMFGDRTGEEDAPVTMKDLEFLAKQRRRRSSALGSEVSTNGVDKIGNELLGAHDNPELEEMILQHRLKLDEQPHGGGGGGEEEEELLRKRSFQVQSSRGGGSGSGVDATADLLSRRMMESTRHLRASFSGGMRRVPSGAGVGIAPATMPRPPSHPEIEPGEEAEEALKKQRPTALKYQVISMIVLTLTIMLVIGAILALGTMAVGPPRQPMGEYKVVEAQVGHEFWKYYDFYAGKDSAGSNGYITYVSEEVARKDGIIEVITEIVPRDKMIEVYEKGDPRLDEDWMAEDLAFLDYLKRKKEEQEEEDEEEDEEEESAKEKEAAEMETEEEDGENSTGKKANKGDGKGDENKSTTIKEKKSTAIKDKAGSSSKETNADDSQTAKRHLQRDVEEDTASIISSDKYPPPKLEPFNPDHYVNGTHGPPSETFVRISSSPTPEGPRNSVRLEGRRRFNRGLFIIDLRHMPAGCGTWPAFWLTDEANWPVNGEIDIVEGVNYQDTAKTALHTTRECKMDSVPEGSKTGSWDTAVGIPNRKTGIPDMTFRYAQNCFVYDPHQWINQGCVATDLKMEGRSLGMPLNANGGGVYALEWDPVNRHIRTWVFSPHGRVPRNLREALRTAQNADESTRIAPDTNQWGLPYGNFPIGEGTNCPSEHFRNMRLVINLAFCGSVSGNRYFMDCPEKFKKFKTCNEYVKSDPEELKEAYWKIRGVYVYERAWERQWT